MEYKIRYLPVSRRNLDDILEYLSGFYPGTPSRFVAELRRCIDNLRTQPLMYAIYADVPIYRHIPVGDYIVFYVVNKSKKTVEIHRILHGKQNIQKVLDEEGR
ncbi:MAG: type II toxin-antitoxin system RelE/ParE family toxin [Bacillota bacterium]|nr:type II toxin-antitoxin system RelE/ParE family toxin [Bacillota bacterium]